MTPNTELSLENHNIIIKENKEFKAKYPLLNFERIIINSCNYISVPLMEYCYLQGVNIYSFSRNGKLRLKLESLYSLSSYIRENQFIQYLDESCCLYYSKAFIQGKISNQIDLFAEYRNNHLNQLNIN